MARPDMASSTTIDTSGGPENAAGTGGDNGPENETTEETNDTINEPAGDTDPLGGGEAEEVGGDAEQTEDETPSEEPGPESGAVDLDSIKAEVRQQVLEEIKKEQAFQPPAPPTPPPAPMTEQDWVKKEEEWGIPRAAIQATTNQAIRVYNEVLQKMDQKMDERFARFEKAESLRELAREKGFTDANRYPQDIDEFLSHYQPKHHSNKDLLRQAIIYARGKNIGKTVQKVMTNKERNMKIAGAGRPASGGAAVRQAPSNVKLTPIQRSAARVAGMSDAEYAKLKSSPRVLGA